MKTPVLQSLTHRGTVSAAGYFVASSYLNEETMRQRVLKLWRENARLFRADHGLVLLFAEPSMVDCRLALALPLVRDGNLLTSFPLRKKDAKRLRASSETLVLAVEGVVLTICLDSLATENPSEWLDVTRFVLTETMSLGEAVTAPISVSEIEDLDLREKLAGVPAADNELKAILESIRAKKQTLTKSSSTASGDGVANGLSSVGSVFSDFFRAFWNGLLDGAKESGGSGRGKGDLGASAAMAPPKTDQLRKMFVRAAFFLKIGQLIGRKQARYLMKMMEMFEKGDLTEALKHAIPLNDMNELGKLSVSMPSLGFLRPRDSIGLKLQRQEGGGNVFLDNPWFNDLRALYRQTYERLVAQKRFEEAAFVLDELLNSHAEAVEFLEKHGKFRLAAELAEARKLPKETQARQWMLAGETEKAMRIAVLYDCFEYVVARLEAKQSELATGLRVLWAENLAAKGNYSAAVDTIWPLEERRSRAIEWFDNAIAFGGPKSSAMLAKRISLLPAEFEYDKARVLELADANGVDAPIKRAEFARESLKLMPNLELRLLARPIARALLADSAVSFRHFSDTEFRAFVNFSEDFSLRTDLPAASVLLKPIQNEIVRLSVDSEDRGAANIFDAIYLPDGKIALALGENGVRLISRKGSTIAHFDQPTTRFVPSVSRSTALCLADRGEIKRIAKLDFVSRRAEYLGECKVDAFAPDFDGRIWFVANGDAVYAIDTEAKDFRALWSVEIDGSIFGLARTDFSLEFFRGGAKIENWRYELPSLTLRGRKESPVKLKEYEDEFNWVTAAGLSVANVGARDGHLQETRVYERETKKATIPFPEDTVYVEDSAIIGKIFMLVSLSQNAKIVRIFDFPDKPIAEFSLPLASCPSARLGDREVVITDSDGRVIIFDHKERVLRCNERF